MQAFLLGIPNVFVGFRDYQGKLQVRFQSRRLSVALAHPSCSRRTASARSRCRVSCATRCVSLQMPACLSVHTSQPHAWHPSQGLSFGAEILSFLELHISSQEASSSDPAVWRLSFDAPFTHVQLRQLEAHEVKTLSQDDGPARVGFLKREHYAWLRDELDKRQERSIANA